jgi:hypothetical protein
MTARWHVVQYERASELKAAIEIVRRGFPVYLPTITKTRHHNHRLEEVTVPRFPPYLFTQFDAERDSWGTLLSTEAKRAGIVKVLCKVINDRPYPIPVPDKAIAAVRAYMPSPEVTNMPRVYRIGEPVTVYIAGTPFPGIFMGYERKRAMVKTWLFGRENVHEVSEKALEPDAEAMEARA